jgi:hypothetical protein
VKRMRRSANAGAKTTAPAPATTASPPPPAAPAATIAAATPPRARAARAASTARFPAAALLREKDPSPEESIGLGTGQLHGCMGNQIVRIGGLGADGLGAWGRLVPATARTPRRARVTVARTRIIAARCHGGRQR